MPQWVNMYNLPYRDSLIWGVGTQPASYVTGTPICYTNPGEEAAFVNIAVASFDIIEMSFINPFGNPDAFEFDFDSPTVFDGAVIHGHRVVIHSQRVPDTISGTREQIYPSPVELDRLFNIESREIWYQDNSEPFDTCFPSVELLVDLPLPPSASPFWTNRRLTSEREL